MSNYYYITILLVALQMHSTQAMNTPEAESWSIIMKVRQDIETNISKAPISNTLIAATTTKINNMVEKINAADFTNVKYYSINFEGRSDHVSLHYTNQEKTININFSYGIDSTVHELLLIKVIKKFLDEKLSHNTYDIYTTLEDQYGAITLVTASKKRLFFASHFGDGFSVPHFRLGYGNENPLLQGPSCILDNIKRVVNIMFGYKISETRYDPSTNLFLETKYNPTFIIVIVSSSAILMLMTLKILKNILNFLPI